MDEPEEDADDGADEEIAPEREDKPPFPGARFPGDYDEIEEPTI